MLFDIKKHYLFKAIGPKWEYFKGEGTPDPNQGWELSPSGKSYRRPFGQRSALEVSDKDAKTQPQGKADIGDALKRNRSTEKIPSGKKLLSTVEKESKQADKKPGKVYTDQSVDTRSGSFKQEDKNPPTAQDPSKRISFTEALKRNKGDQTVEDGKKLLSTVAKESKQEEKRSGKIYTTGQEDDDKPIQLVGSSNKKGKQDTISFTEVLRQNKSDKKVGGDKKLKATLEEPESFQSQLDKVKVKEENQQETDPNKTEETDPNTQTGSARQGPNQEESDQEDDNAFNSAVQSYLDSKKNKNTKTEDKEDNSADKTKDEKDPKAEGKSPKRAKTDVKGKFRSGMQAGSELGDASAEAEGAGRLGSSIIQYGANAGGSVGHSLLNSGGDEKETGTKKKDKSEGRQVSKSFLETESLIKSLREDIHLVSNDLGVTDVEVEFFKSVKSVQDDYISPYTNKIVGSDRSKFGAFVIGRLDEKIGRHAEIISKSKK